MRRTLAVFLAVASCAVGCQRLIDLQVERTLARVDESVLRSPDLQIVLCGTGSPIADATRAAACTAVIAGGHFFLVDAGPGSVEVVDLADLPLGHLEGVLLTHFHSDHIGDLGEAITQSWIAGRAQPLDVYGPTGVAAIVHGFREAYAADVEARVLHHGELFMPRADLLIHEALDADLTGRAVAAARRLGMQRLAKLASDISGYHSTPREVGEVAQQAGVAHLVLTHLVPPPRNFIVRRAFTSDASEAFRGKVTLGEDGMRFSLAPR